MSGGFASERTGYEEIAVPRSRLHVRVLLPMLIRQRESIHLSLALLPNNRKTRTALLCNGPLVQRACPLRHHLDFSPSIHPSPLSNLVALSATSSTLLCSLFPPLPRYLLGTHEHDELHVLACEFVDGALHVNLLAAHANERRTILRHSLVHLMLQTETHLLCLAW